MSGSQLERPSGPGDSHRLVAEADAFVHSFRPGVPESLGIDYATLEKINPKLVYHYAASYGSVGPYRRQPAIDPIIAAFAGTTAYQSGEGHPPLREAGADPIAAVGHATSLMLGLFERHRSGQGQYIESAMILSNLYLNLEDAFSFAGKAPRPAIDYRQLGTGATYRLYETAPIEPGTERQPYENPDPAGSSFRPSPTTSSPGSARSRGRIWRRIPVMRPPRPGGSTDQIWSSGSNTCSRLGLPWSGRAASSLPESDVWSPTACRTSHSCTRIVRPRPMS